MSLEKWLAELPHGEDYAVIIVADDGLTTFIHPSFSKRFYWTEANKYSLTGIHVKHLRVYANMDKHPQEIQLALKSVATGYHHEILPL